jgi:Mrp family chromosome partitioning ATPase/uncharacterized protein involved in exopolysaccharide biosynthesis
MRDQAGASIVSLPEISGVTSSLPVIIPASTGELTYVTMLKQRWRLAAALAITLFILAGTVILKTPKTYQADVLVLLQPSRILPLGANTAGVQPDLKQKLDAMREQVLSRRTLLEVTRKLELNRVGTRIIPDDAAVERLREAITLKSDKSGFRLFVEHTDPHTAAAVANELARLYIAENVRISRQNLNDTTAYIVARLEILNTQVKQMEHVLQDFRKQNIGSMPEDVPANQALLLALSNQATQSETSLESEIGRKQQIEGRLAEVLSVAISQRQRTMKKLAMALKQFPPLGDDASRESQSKVDEILLKVPFMGGRAQGPSSKNDNSGGDLDIKAGTGVSEASFTAIGDSDDPGIQVLKEQLRGKEIAVRDAEQNIKSLETLRAKGMLSDVAYSKAQNDLDRARIDLRVQRAQGLILRNEYLERMSLAATELSGISEFQTLWSEALSKIQEFESQQIKDIDNGTTDKEREILRPSDAPLIALERLRQRQEEGGGTLFAARGELAGLVQEHENIISTILRRRGDIRQMRVRMAELDRRLNKSAKVQVELPELMRRYKTVTDQFDDMLKYKTQSELAMGVDDQQEGGRMLIWDSAVPPMSTYRPKYASLFSLAALGSMALGAGFVLLLGSFESLVMTSKFLSAEDLHLKTSTEVIASIQQAQAGSILHGGQTSGDVRIVPLCNLHHPTGRDFLNCCSLLFRFQKRCPQVIAVCSPGAGDGKTFVSANLALALASAENENVLVIDANLKMPSFHSVFNVPISNGLAESLEAQRLPHFHDFDLQPNLRVLTAGFVRGHSATIVGSNTFKDLMVMLRREHSNSRIIIDTPSMQSGPDAELLTDSVDGVILVVRRGHTHVADVLRAIKRIPRQKLIGLIFNSSKPTES